MVPVEIKGPINELGILQTSCGFINWHKFLEASLALLLTFEQHGLNCAILLHVDFFNKCLYRFEPR